MGRVGHEAAQTVLGPLALGEGVLDAFEHGVEGQAQAPDFSVVVGRGDAAAQVSGGDLVGRGGHTRERAHGDAHKPEAHAGHGEGDADRDQELDVAEVGQGSADIAQGQGDDQRLAGGADGRHAHAEVGPAWLGGGDGDRPAGSAGAGVGVDRNRRKSRRESGRVGPLPGRADDDAAEHGSVVIADLEERRGAGHRVEGSGPTDGVGVARPEQLGFDAAVEEVQLLVDALQQRGTESRVADDGGDDQANDDEGRRHGHEPGAQRHSTALGLSRQAQAVADAPDGLDHRRPGRVELLA